MTKHPNPAINIISNDVVYYGKNKKIKGILIILEFLNLFFQMLMDVLFSIFMGMRN